MSYRVGSWYMVTPQEEGVSVAWQKEMVDKAEPKVGHFLFFLMLTAHKKRDLFRVA